MNNTDGYLALHFLETILEERYLGLPHPGV